MKIEKIPIRNLKMSYAVSFFHCGNEIRGIAASEGEEDCFLFPLDNPSRIETVWEHAGGTMGLVQLDEKGNFFAVQNFFKGFHSETACIVRAEKLPDGTWSVEKYLDLPYVHRFGIVNVKDRKFLIACTLCGHKEFKEDWSSPGSVYLGELPEGTTRPCKLRILIPSITKNHGFYQGRLDGKETVLVSGQEGLYAIQIPEEPDGEWRYKKVMEKEISDATVADIDGDGEDEIVTIEGFHGNRAVINKRVNDAWEEVYSYPVRFGHVVWGGKILGLESLLIGYREENAALILMRKKPGSGFSMEHIFIDEQEGPTNISVLSEPGRCRILCSCGRTQRIVLYQLTEE